jgi:hypothetical protein
MKNYLLIRIFLLLFISSGVIPHGIQAEQCISVPPKLPVTKTEKNEMPDFIFFTSNLYQ